MINPLNNREAASELGILRKAKIYLDTSVISSLFDDRNPERKSLTASFFRETERFEAFVSEITLAEIERTSDERLREKMKEVVQPFSIIALSDVVERLSAEYISRGAVPENYPEDAYHIAVAVTSEMDFLLSWNFKHIVRRKTRDIVKMVNTLYGFRQIEIMTPAELF